MVGLLQDSGAELIRVVRADVVIANKCVNNGIHPRFIEDCVILARQLNKSAGKYLLPGLSVIADKSMATLT